MKYKFYHIGSEFENYPILDCKVLYIKNDYEWKYSLKKINGSGFTGKVLSVLIIEICLFRHLFNFTFEFNERTVTPGEAYKGYHKIKE